MPISFIVSKDHLRARPESPLQRRVMALLFNSLSSLFDSSAHFLKLPESHLPDICSNILLPEEEVEP